LKRKENQLLKATHLWLQPIFKYELAKVIGFRSEFIKYLIENSRIYYNKNGVLSLGADNSVA
jgi:hypothetical protein